MKKSSPPRSAKRKMGRPRQFDNPVRVTTILESTSAKWLADQPEGQSGAVRRLVREAMK